MVTFFGHVFADGDVALSAKQIRSGCSVAIHKEYPSGVDPNISSAVFDQQPLWECDGAEAVTIGRIEAERGGSEIVTVFYRANEVVVLARWASASAGADFQGDFYQASAYRLEAVGNKTTFKAIPAITKVFGDGYDGLFDGKRVTFPYKDAASICARLAALGL